jgi:hypothetical protein
MSERGNRGKGRRGAILLAKISLDTPASLLERVLSRSSTWAVSSLRASSLVYGSCE